MRYPEKVIVDFENLLPFLNRYRMNKCDVKINDNKSSKAIYYRSKVVIWRPSGKIRVVSKALPPNLKRVPTPMRGHQLSFVNTPAITKKRLERFGGCRRATTGGHRPVFQSRHCRSRFSRSPDPPVIAPNSVRAVLQSMNTWLHWKYNHCNVNK